MALAEGDVFAGYTVVRPLGAGGMGEVYLVQHPRLPRYDALKILPAQFTIDGEYRERFNREADMVARLWHPNIVGVHDRGEDNGQLWITMDYVEGTDAGRLLRDYQGGGLPPEDVVRIVSGVADALDYAHQQELLHRDVKPSNILLAQANQKFSRALLADFGIARRVQDASGLTATDMTVGTVAYAAPEQLMGETLDGRADQYALAATAFHLITGQQLFQHDNPAVVISNHLTARPPEIGDRIPELSGLGPAFDRALAKSPADRYATCTEFAEAMTEGLSAAAQELGATDSTMPAPVARQANKHVKTEPGSRRLRLGLLAAGILAVLIGGAIAIGIGVVRWDDSTGQPALPRRGPMRRSCRLCSSVQIARRSEARDKRRADSKRIARDCRRPVTRSGRSTRAPCRTRRALPAHPTRCIPQVSRSRCASASVKRGRAESNVARMSARAILKGRPSERRAQTFLSPSCSTAVESLRRHGTLVGVVDHPQEGAVRVAALGVPGVLVVGVHLTLAVAVLGVGVDGFVEDGGGLLDHGAVLADVGDEAFHLQGDGAGFVVAVGDVGFGALAGIELVEFFVQGGDFGFDVLADAGGGVVDSQGDLFEARGDAGDGTAGGTTSAG